MDLNTVHPVRKHGIVTHRSQRKCPNVNSVLGLPNIRRIDFGTQYLLRITIKVYEGVKATFIGYGKAAITCSSIL